MNKLYKLIEYQKEITDLQYIVNILNWELRVACPKDSQEYVIDLITQYELKLFDLMTSDKYKLLLEDVINSTEFNSLEKAEQNYIKNLLKQYESDINVPKEFYEEYVSLCSNTTNVWEKAKKDNDYASFKPYLENIIKNTKKLYSYRNASKDLYDVMLDYYESGMNSEIIDKLFEDIKRELVPLIKKVSADEEKEIKKQDYTEEELLDCAKFLLEYIGFDMNKGVLGIYPHGFTEKMGADDVRIAFERTNNPIDFITTIIHEGGHGIFEQNIKKTLSRYGNVCIDHLYGLHESVSRFYENILGRRKTFWIPIYDEIKTKLKLDYTLDEFVDRLNEIKYSPIRTSADELTYCMHIIIRYEIERELFNGKITADELPDVWKKKTKEYLGLDIKNDSEGPMQDVHWAEGNFGYFPSYLLGNVYGGMFLQAIEEQLGSIDKLLKKGKIKDITEFLRKNIFQNGGAYNSLEIIKKLCKSEIRAEPIIEYFKNKYEK